MNEFSKILVYLSFLGENGGGFVANHAPAIRSYKTNAQANAAYTTTIGSSLLRTQQESKRPKTTKTRNY